MEHDDLLHTYDPIEIDWPPRPDDGLRPTVTWHTFVGGLGRILIAAGLLLFGFVAYQLWGTGIQQARSQDRLQSRFERLLGEPSSAPTTAPASTAPTTGAPTPAPGPGGTAPAATTSAPTTTPPPAETPAFSPGDPIARLVIPRIGVDQVVVSGVELADLKNGPGHYPDTPLPGQIGNAAIAGHRSTFGAPFARVDELERGDAIEITRLDGARYVYKVTDSRVVEPTETEVVANTPDAVLTLTSCWPKFSADKRIVVRAALDATASAPAAPAPPTTAAATAAAATAPSTTTGPPATATTAVTTPPPTSAPASAAGDAFQQGWWADDAAWGDVIAWGSALSAIALVAWSISRRTRRNWIGAVVGVGPFLVVLYFFYENAARLLPPNI